ncbi:hypothetical protein AB1Y20_000396 [Prymnesium parvum]|uniref:Protein RFT1 homolog n=1 Tax=Prymnesium parvum TaxID=97485 RepID=A0AB34KAB7_PRYPA
MACEAWCVHSCEELNGDPWRECSGCPHEYACSSRSWPDFRSASPDVAPLATAQPLRSAEAAAVAMAIAASAVVVLECRREPRRREAYPLWSWFSALTCWTGSRPASTSRSFALARVMCGALCATVFYHRWELGPLECMQCVPESCDAELSDDGLLYQHSWLVAALVGAALAVAGGRARRLLAFVALAAWLVHLSHGCSIAPHYPFVTCSILYIGTAPLHADTTRQRSTKRRSDGVEAGDAAALQLVLLRGTLALSYGGGGLAKLVFTPGWADGRFFESIFNTLGFARAAVPRSILFQLARASVPLTWATLAIECGLPAFELAASCSGTLAQARAAVYLLSASMHVVILCVLPLTEVSIGMLAFHAALLHATLNEETREARAQSKKLLVIWRRVSRIALLAMLSLRSLRCFLLPLFATCERECLGVVLRPAGMGELFVKAALPLATTSFENWPCVNRQEDTSFDPAVLASQLQLIQTKCLIVLSSGLAVVMNGGFSSL